MFVGETNYCARVISDQEYREISKKEHMFCVKFLDVNDTELRSKVVSLIIRISVQLEQLRLLFLKKENARIVHLEREIVLRFYIYQNNFYISSNTGFLSCEEHKFTSMIHDIVQDTSCPLYTKLDQVIFPKNITETTDWIENIEVEEDEEPPYKKKRTETLQTI
jgi:hypothetical protein